MASELIAAAGLALAVEGLFYGGFPNAARRMALQVAQAPDNLLRMAGIGAMALGVLVVWLARG